MSLYPLLLYPKSLLYIALYWVEWWAYPFVLCIDEELGRNFSSGLHAHFDVVHENSTDSHVLYLHIHDLTLLNSLENLNGIILVSLDTCHRLDKSHEQSSS